MTGWHTLACALGDTAHLAYEIETNRANRPGNYLRRNRNARRFKSAALRRVFAYDYDNYRISLCRKMRHCDIRKGGA